MKKFMVLYSSAISVGEQMSNSSPEEAKAGMDAWMSWAKAAGEAIVDLGMPLQAAKKLASGSVSDSSSTVSGYSIMQAETAEALSDILSHHPHLQMPGGSSIDTFEVLPMPGM